MTTETMATVQARSIRIGLAVAAIVVLFDQVTKWWILTKVMQPPQVIVVTPFLDLVLAWNRGVSFGLFSHEADYMPYALVAVALTIVVAMLIWLARTERWFLAVCLGSVIGGAIGNVTDRFRFGAVVDFLYFHAGDWYWPAFNVADSAISIGVILIVVDGLFSHPQSGRSQPGHSHSDRP